MSSRSLFDSGFENGSTSTYFNQYLSPKSDDNNNNLASSSKTTISNVTSMSASIAISEKAKRRSQSELTESKQKLAQNWGTMAVSEADSNRSASDKNFCRLLQLRSALDSKQFYKKGTIDQSPIYQIGTIIGGSNGNGAGAAASGSVCVNASERAGGAYGSNSRGVDVDPVKALLKDDEMRRKIRQRVAKVYAHKQANGRGKGSLKLAKWKRAKYA